MNKSDTLSKLAPALVKAQAAMAGATKSAANPDKLAAKGSA